MVLPLKSDLQLLWVLQDRQGSHTCASRQFTLLLHVLVADQLKTRKKCEHPWRDAPDPSLFPLILPCSQVLRKMLFLVWSVSPALAIISAALAGTLLFVGRQTNAAFRLRALWNQARSLSFDNTSVGSCRRFGSPGASELPTKGRRGPFQRRHELQCELGKTMTRIVGRETQ